VGRNEQKNKQETKQTHKHKKTFRFRNNRISVSVVLVLLLQHPAPVLVFKQRLCLISLGDWQISPVFLLSFSGSCLVSSSLNEVWQFEFVCCPQVPEISSVALQTSCFGVGFLLCWLTGGLFLCLSPFL
jgi:hypothetical protein